MIKLWDGADAAEILALDRDGDCFRSKANQGNFGGAIFGGQFLGQALMAATATVAEGQYPHSLHALFVEAGRIDAPIDYHVQRLRDGKSSSNRRVTAMQGDRILCELTTSLAAHRASEIAHQAPFDPAPAPEDCPEIADYVRTHADRLPAFTVDLYGRDMPFERRLIDPEQTFFETGDAPMRRFWIRVPGAATIRDEGSQRALIAAVSDAWLFTASFIPHVPQGQMNARFASLDHAVWIHESGPVDEWMLYVTESPWAGHSRGVGIGRLYDRGGRLLATSAQEGVAMYNRAWKA